MILSLSACKLDNWIILKSYVKVKAGLLKNAFHYSNEVYFCIQIQSVSGVGKNSEKFRYFLSKKDERAIFKIQKMHRSTYSCSDCHHIQYILDLLIS